MTIRHNGIEINTQLRIIKHGDRVLRFRQPLRFILFKHLILGHHTCGMLFDLLHGNDPNGGPLQGPSYVCILFLQSRRDMQSLGLRLSKTRHRYTPMTYHLEPIGDDT